MDNNNQWYSLLKKIEECIQDSNYVNESNKNIPMIELDMAMEKLSTIYNTLFELKIKSFACEETGFLSKSSTIISEVISKTAFKENNLSKPDIKNEIKVKPVVQEPEKQIQPEAEVKMEEAEKPEIIAVENKVEEKPQVETTPEVITVEENKTIAEKMASVYKKKDISTLQQMKPISNLKQAISINDKIKYIRELFGNNVDDYNATVQQINTSANLDEALAILDKKFTIDSENEVMQSFLELVYRRFLS